MLQVDIWQRRGRHVINAELAKPAKVVNRRGTKDDPKAASASEEIEEVRLPPSLSMSHPYFSILDCLVGTAASCLVHITQEHAWHCSRGWLNLLSWHYKRHTPYDFAYEVGLLKLGCTDVQQ